MVDVIGSPADGGTDLPAHSEAKRASFATQYKIKNPVFTGF